MREEEEEQEEQEEGGEGGGRGGTGGGKSSVHALELGRRRNCWSKEVSC